MKDQVKRYRGVEGREHLVSDLGERTGVTGYGALWIGGSKDSELLVAEEMLKATSTVVVATGIVNVWSTDPDVVGQAFHRLEERYPGRFLLGVGAGHRRVESDRLREALHAVKHTWTALTPRRPSGGDGPRRPRQRHGATVRPSVAGSSPATSPRRPTRRLPGTYWASPLLAPEQKVVLGSDPETTRSVARASRRRSLSATAELPEKPHGARVRRTEPE